MGAPPLGLCVEKVYETALVVVFERFPQRRRREGRPLLEQLAAPRRDAQQQRACGLRAANSGIQRRSILGRQRAAPVLIPSESPCS